MRRNAFMWRGKVRSSHSTDARTARPGRSKRPCVQVRADVYAALTERALEYGVTNKALLEYVLRDLPRSTRMERSRAAKGRHP